jgi:predicted HAD superfamily Cof-like phosphohydrolase
VTQKPCRYILALREFHAKAGHLINLTPTVVQASIRFQRYRLILEELGEMTCAFHERELVNFADGLADFTYVVIGTAVVYGVHLDETWLQTLEDNWHRHKLMEPYLIGWSEAALDVVKIGKAISRLLTATLYADLTGIRNYLAEIIENAFEFSYGCGIPLSEVFDEIHRSNMTKNLVACDAAQKYGQSQALVKGPGYIPPDVAKVIGLKKTEGSA